MKCEIIRDLLPMYLDGLTSEESNKAIGEHLDGCEPCKEVLERMKSETEVKAEEVKKKINPFRKFNRKMKASIAAAVAVCIAFGGLGYKAFGQGFAIDPDEMTMDVRAEENMLYLDFTLENGNLMHYGTMYDSTMASIALREVWKMPGDDLGEYPNKFSWGMDMNVLTVGTGKSVEVQMVDGSLTVMEVQDEENVAIQNGDAGPTSMMVFREGDEAVSVTLGNMGEEGLQEYIVEIDYGEEIVTYTLAELLEMAK